MPPTQPKTYFLAPTRDVPPSGPIFLGSIVKSPRSPELSLNTKTHPILSALEIHESITTNETRALSTSHKGKVSLFGEFLSGLPLGLDASIGTNWDSTSTFEYKISSLLTRTIYPSQTEIAALFRDENVQAAIKDSHFKANLYIIMGVKIARGAEVLISKVREKGGNLHFGADLTSIAVPIKLGPDVETSRGKGQSIKENHAQEFVWAYRLREVRYRRKEVVEVKEYVKGDLMGKGQRKHGKYEEGAEYKAEVLGLDGGEVGGEEWDGEERDVVDEEGEVVSCVVFGGEEE